MVVTYRVDDALPPELRRLGRGALATALGDAHRARAAGRDDVALQLEALAGGPVPAGLADELHARAGGNPFFVEELFAARDALPASRGGGAGARRAPRPARARPARRGRRARVARPARAPRRRRPMRSARRSTPACSSPSRDGVAFRHGLIGEVIYERLLPAERRALHRAIAAALDARRSRRAARAPVRPGRAARAGAGGVGPGRAGGRGVHAYAEAGVHFERALELWDASRRPGRAARSRGPGRAVRRRPGASGRAVPGGDRAHRRARAQGAALRAPGRVPLLGRRGCARVLRPRARAAAGRAAAAGRRRPRAVRAAPLGRGARALRGGARAGAGPRITLGLVLAYLGEPDVGEAHLRRALELAANGEETARAYLHLGDLLRLRGDRAAAFAAMVDGEREAAGSGCAARSGTSCTSTGGRPAAPGALGRGRGTARRGRADRPVADVLGAAEGDRGGVARLARRRRDGPGASSTGPATTGCPASSWPRWAAPGPRWRCSRAISPPRAARRRRPRRRPGSALHAAAVLARAAGGGRNRRTGPGAPAHTGPRSRRRPPRGSGGSGRSTPVPTPAPALARAEHARVQGDPAPRLWEAAAEAFHARAVRRRRCAPARGRGHVAGRRRPARRAAGARRRARHRGRARGAAAARGGGGAGAARAARPRRLPPPPPATTTAWASRRARKRCCDCSPTG